MYKKFQIIIKIIIVNKNFIKKGIEKNLIVKNVTSKKNYNEKKTTKENN